MSPWNADVLLVRAADSLHLYDEEGERARCDVPSRHGGGEVVRYGDLEEPPTMCLECVGPADWWVEGLLPEGVG